MGDRKQPPGGSSSHRGRVRAEPAPQEAVDVASCSGGHDDRGRTPRPLREVGAEHVEAVLSVSGRRLLVVDPAQVDDDLVDDVTEILTSLCARLYGPAGAADRAARAVAAIGADIR